MLAQPHLPQGSPPRAAQLRGKSYTAGILFLSATFVVTPSPQTLRAARGRKGLHHIKGSRRRGLLRDS